MSQAGGWLAAVNDVDVAAGRLAQRQYGLVTRAQLRSLGMTDRQITARLASGLLEPVHRGVLRMPAVARSPEQAVLAACLAAGAVASHRSAAALWGLRGVERPPIDVTVPGQSGRRLAGVVVHRSAGLEAHDVIRRLGIPVTTPGRTLLDLGAVAPRLVEAAMEDALFRGLVSEAALRRVLDRAGTHGRNGTAVLRDLLDRREPGRAPTESPLEDELVRLLRRHGLPEPVRQHPVALGAGREARIDLAYPELRLGIEADGRRWHSGRADFERDRARANRLAAHGWTMLRFGPDAIRRRGGTVAAEVRAVRQALETRAAVYPR